MGCQSQCNLNGVRMSTVPDLLIVEAHGVVDGLPSDLPKDGVLPIQVITAVQCDEELAVVGVGGILVGACYKPPADRRGRLTLNAASLLGKAMSLSLHGALAEGVQLHLHCQGHPGVTGTPVVELEACVELVAEGVSIHRLPSQACPCGVPSLGHEVLVDSKEGRVVIVALQAQLQKVAHCLHTSVSDSGTWHDSILLLTISDQHVSGVTFGASLGHNSMSMSPREVFMMTCMQQRCSDRTFTAVPKHYETVWGPGHSCRNDSESAWQLDSRYLTGFNDLPCPWWEVQDCILVTC